MNGAHHATPPVPAHRVLNRNGMLSGEAHFATPTRMEDFLMEEPLKVDNDTVLNCEHFFWDPAHEVALCSQLGRAPVCTPVPQ